MPHTVSFQYWTKLIPGRLYGDDWDMVAFDPRYVKSNVPRKVLVAAELIQKSQRSWIEHGISMSSCYSVNKP